MGAILGLIAAIELDNQRDNSDSADRRGDLNDKSHLLDNICAPIKIGEVVGGTNKYIGKQKMKKITNVISKSSSDILPK